MSARPYWPYYCEENVWHACEEALHAKRDAWAVFVSNAAGRVAMWSQRAAPAGEPILWDYHVVLLERRDGRPAWWVRDPDCRAGRELPASDWLAHSFPAAVDVPTELAPHFRLVPAAEYRAQLCSDRSHMRQGDGWQAPPPPWPTIGEGSNLMRFVDVEQPFVGELLDLAGLRERVASLS